MSIRSLNCFLRLLPIAVLTFAILGCGSSADFVSSTPELLSATTLSVPPYLAQDAGSLEDGLAGGQVSVHFLGTYQGQPSAATARGVLGQSLPQNDELVPRTASLSELFAPHDRKSFTGI